MYQKLSKSADLLTYSKRENVDFLRHSVYQKNHTCIQPQLSTLSQTK